MKRSAAFFWWDVCVENWTTAARLAETMAAVPVVVNRRLPMIDAAIRNPISGDYVELTTMVWEKVEASTLAAMSLAADLQAIQGAMLHPPRSTAAASSASLRIGRLAAGAAGRALAPVHARATSNAKRLTQRKGSRK